ncbi:MAG TPA: xylose isomerase [Planctomycetaceae bacterium]|nr:xylose isomerase [Planctomycetaceae bacterium]
MTSTSTRRSFLTTSAGAVVGTTASTGLAAINRLPASATQKAKEGLGKLRYCLNTSTIKIGKHPIEEQLEIAAGAGYDGVELWLRDIDAFTERGGKLPELKRRIDDLGLTVDSAIAFGKWIVDDEAERKKGLDQCRRDMEIVAALGGKRIAAPPAGATNGSKLNLSDAAERYAALLDVGASVGVQPQLELWGFSKNLSTLAEVLYVVAGARHKDACLLLDVYHMYKGGDDFESIGLVPGQKMHCLHINDYPADPPRPLIKDEHRVYPGDGVAPMTRILRSLVGGGFEGTLSLELFNRSYWQQPAKQVAATGLAKMKACVAAAAE